MRIAEVPAYVLKQTGVSRSRQTAYNWTTKGVKVAGQTIKLQTETNAGQLFTKTEWVDAFLAQISRMTP